MAAREYWIMFTPGMLPEVWAHRPDLMDSPDFRDDIEVVHVMEVIE